MPECRCRTEGADYQKKWHWLELKSAIISITSRCSTIELSRQLYFWSLRTHLNRLHFHIVADFCWCSQMNFNFNWELRIRIKTVRLTPVSITLFPRWIAPFSGICLLLKGRDQWEWIGLWKIAIKWHLVRIVVIYVHFYFYLAAILE